MSHVRTSHAVTGICSLAMHRGEKPLHRGEKSLRERNNKVVHKETPRMQAGWHAGPLYVGRGHRESDHRPLTASSSSTRISSQPQAQHSSARRTVHIVEAVALLELVDRTLRAEVLEVDVARRLLPVGFVLGVAAIAHHVPLGLQSVNRKTARSQDKA